MQLDYFVAIIVGLGVAGAGVASAQTTVVLPDTSQTTTVSATVSEQARVLVPAGISFNVTNVATSTVAAPASITIDQIVLGSATKQLRVSVRAAAAAFTPPATGDGTWTAADVSWNSGTWSSATGVSGTLSSSTFSPVATCDVGAAACSTSALVFSLEARPTVRRSGTHTLVVTWKVESIGT